MYAARGSLPLKIKQLSQGHPKDLCNRRCHLEGGVHFARFDPRDLSELHVDLVCQGLHGHPSPLSDCAYVLAECRSECGIFF